MSDIKIKIMGGKNVKGMSTLIGVFSNRSENSFQLECTVGVVPPENLPDLYLHLQL